MASLLRNAAVRRSAALCCAGPSNSLPVATFATSTRSLIADNKTDATPARVHRTQSDAAGEGQGKTQREAIASAIGVLDTLARDVSPPSAPTSSPPVSTPSSPGLEAVYDTTGPVYTPSTLPPRTDATLEFLTNLLMKEGKKAQAQRFTTRTLSILATVTNSNPLPLVHDAIERTAPLVKLQSKKQGGKSLQVPVALTQRQSTRKALTWIIEASKKRPDREIEKRLAAEFLAVIEGTSSAIAKKEEQHRMATVNRANAAVRI